MTLPGRQTRYGRFLIPWLWIDDVGSALAALDGCIVVRAECRYDRLAIEYIAIHPSFDECRDGETCPDYAVILQGGRRHFERRGG